MSIPGVCPTCAAKFPLEAALQDARAREALRCALRLAPSLADPIVTYLGLFSPEDRRAIRMDRLAALLAELADAIGSAQIERHGRAWSAPLELWREALARILARRDSGKLDLPLKTHGLLFEIVAGLASRGEGRAEQHREDARRTGEGTRTAAPQPASASMPAHLRDGGWRRLLGRRVPDPSSDPSSEPPPEEPS